MVFCIPWIQVESARRYGCHRHLHVYHVKKIPSELHRLHYPSSQVYFKWPLLNDVEDIFLMLSH